MATPRYTRVRNAPPTARFAALSRVSHNSGERASVLPSALPLQSPFFPASARGSARFTLSFPKRAPSSLARRRLWMPVEVHPRRPRLATKSGRSTGRRPGRQNWVTTLEPTPARATYAFSRLSTLPLLLLCDRKRRLLDRHPAQPLAAEPLAVERPRLP